MTFGTCTDLGLFGMLGSSPLPRREENPTKRITLFSSAVIVFAACSSPTDPPTRAITDPPPSPFDAGTRIGDATAPPTDAPVPPTPGQHSHYLTAADGTRVAVTVWLPEAVAGAKVASIVRFTRYWRATDYADPAAAETDVYEQLRMAYLQQGFAYVAVDARGTGASFGVNPGPWSELEQADARMVLDWIASEPWSSVRAFTIGTSYDGNTAVLAGALGHPALAGIVARFYDHDAYGGGVFPGGLYNAGFVDAWIGYASALDRHDLCSLATMSGMPCDAYRARVRGPLPVVLADLPLVVASHGANLDLAAAMANVQTRDDALGGTESLESVSPFAKHAAITANAVPMLVTASWLDAGTAAGALDGFAAFGNPQTVVIGAFTHGGQGDNDPLGTPLPAANPSIEEQYIEAITFMAQTAAGAPPPASSIRCVTLGERTWRTTTTWPPATTVVEKLSFASGAALRRESSVVDAAGADVYPVNLQATTGTKNRWLTQLGGEASAYGDRSAEDARLSTYTTEVLTENMRITGTPVVRLRLAVDKPDAGVIVYLEDVDANGVSRYVTEGELRLALRAGGAPAVGSERVTGRTYRSDTAAPMPLNTATEIVIPLQPTSALLRAGHRLRLAIAGADAGTFRNVTTVGTNFTIGRGVSGSVLEVPVDRAP